MNWALFPAFGQSNESDPDLVFALNSEGKGRKNLWKKRRLIGGNKWKNGKSAGVKFGEEID